VFLSNCAYVQRMGLFESTEPSQIVPSSFSTYSSSPSAFYTTSSELYGLNSTTSGTGTWKPLSLRVNSPTGAFKLVVRVTF